MRLCVIWHNLSAMCKALQSGTRCSLRKLNWWNAALKIWYIYIRFLIYGAQEKGQYIRNLIYGAQRNFVYINFLLEIFKKSLQNTIKINGILKILSHILKKIACGALLCFIFSLDYKNAARRGENFWGAKNLIYGENQNFNTDLHPTYRMSIRIPDSVRW